MSNKLVKRDSLCKQISDKMEHLIESGKYSVGDRIPTEPELMEIFQVSRNTVREAVQSLTWSGILEVKQGDGTYVRASNRFNANMKQKYSQVSLSDIKETRNCIEVTIAHLSAQRRTEDDLAMISDALAKRKSLTMDIKENTKADMDFHMAIAKSCHNTILIDLYTSISSYLENQIAERHIESKLSEQEIDALHETLFLAIKAGNPDKATAAVEDILAI